MTDSPSTGLNILVAWPIRRSFSGPHRSRPQGGRDRSIRRECSLPTTLRSKMRCNFPGLLVRCSCSLCSFRAVGVGCACGPFCFRLWLEALPPLPGRAPNTFIRSRWTQPSMRVLLFALCAASLFEVEILSRRKSREVLPDTDENAILWATSSSHFIDMQQNNRRRDKGV
jgi:hypothetical protein